LSPLTCWLVARKPVCLLAELKPVWADWTRVEVVVVDCCWRTAVLTAEEIWGWSTARIWAMRASWSRAEVVVVTVDTFWPELLPPKALPTAEPEEELVEPPAVNLEAEPPAAKLEAELPPAAKLEAELPPAVNLEAEAPAVAPEDDPDEKPVVEPVELEKPAALLAAEAPLLILALFSSEIVTKPSWVSTVWAKPSGPAW